MSIAVYPDIHGNPPGLKVVRGLIDRLGRIDRELRLEVLLYGPLARARHPELTLASGPLRRQGRLVA